MYQCKHFKIEELVPENLFREYEKINRVSRLWMVFDVRALMTLDALRERYGQMTVNDWLWGGSRNYRGFRPPGCDVGADLSQHRFGRGFDDDFKDYEAEEVRVSISAMGRTQRVRAGLGYIRRIENGVSWLHFDLGNAGINPHPIKFFTP